MAGETLVLNKNFSSIKQFFSQLLAENVGKIGFSRLYAGRILALCRHKFKLSQIFKLNVGKFLAPCWENSCLAPEFHQSRLQCLLYTHRIWVFLFNFEGVLPHTAQQSNHAKNEVSESILDIFHICVHTVHFVSTSICGKGSPCVGCWDIKFQPLLLPQECIY